MTGLPEFAYFGLIILGVLLIVLLIKNPGGAPPHESFFRWKPRRSFD